MLRTKLCPPQLSSLYLFRGTLINQLQANIDLPLTLISAPSGYGKSILVSQWIQHCQLKAAWISLDEGILDLRDFTVHVIASIQNIIPSSLSTVQHFANAQQMPSAKSIHEELINDLDQIEENFLLILDDYQVIKNHQIHQLINLLLKYPVQNLHLVIICRFDPPLTINKLRLQNRIHEIRTNNLQLSFQELKEVAKNRGYQFSENDLSILYEETEGWILGVQMVLIAHLDHPQSKIKTLAKNYSLQKQADYFTTEFLAQYSTEFQNALYWCSLLDYFNDELLEVIFKKCEPPISLSGNEFVQKVVEHNLFVISDSGVQVTYRFHYLFQKILFQQLRKRIKLKRIHEFYKTISNWYEEKNLIEESVKYALKSSDLDLAAKIIIRHRLIAFDMALFWKMEKLINLLPQEYQMKYPELLLSRLGFFIEMFQIEEFVNAIEDLDILLQNTTNEKLQAELSLFKGCLNAWVRCKPLEAQKNFKQAEIILQDSLNFYYRYAFYSALAYQMSGTKSRGLTFLKNEIKRLTLQNTAIVPHIKVIEFHVYSLSGEFNKALSRGKRYYTFVKGIDHLYSLAWGSYMVGNSAWQLFDLSTALKFFSETIRYKALTEPRIVVDCFAGFTMTLLHHQQDERAEDMLHQLGEYISEMDNPIFRAIADSLMARFQLCKGDHERAMKWARASSLRYNMGEFLFFIEVPVITRLKILVLQGSPVQVKNALECIKTLIPDLSQINNQCHRVELLLLRSLANWKLGLKELVKDDIEQALKLADYGGDVRSFIELGAPILEILKHTNIDDKQIQSQKLNIIQKLQTNIETGNSSFKSHFTTVLLSTREKEIIRILSKGFRNQEIADELNISLETVKSHVKNSLRKLKARNRVELIKRAEHLDLVDNQ